MPANKMKKENYYSILNVDKNAGEEEIKQAYRKLAMEFHPDINAADGAEENFKKISEAYTILSDRDKRRLYDRRAYADLFEQYRQAGFFGGCMGRGMGMGRRCGKVIFPVKSKKQ